jgi:hypothetical protein
MMQCGYFFPSAGGVYGAAEGSMGMYVLVLPINWRVKVFVYHVAAVPIPK